MSYLLQISIVLVTGIACIVNAAAVLQKNITIAVPEGTTTQEDLICYPASWSTVLTFYVGNYIAHAATVRSDPGQPTETAVIKIILSLLYPGGASLVGFFRFRQFAILGKSPLERAARACALCTVVRKDNWEPVDGQYVAPEALMKGERLGHVEEIGSMERLGLLVHGSFSLPEGYALMSLPPFTIVRSLSEAEEGEDEKQLTCSYSFSKALVAVVQLMLSISTLVRTKGNQIDTYGYAAFGLTVAPFAVGSFWNLLSGLVTPEYQCMYMIRSNAMIEAESIPGAFFDGVIGKLGSQDLAYPPGYHGGKRKRANTTDEDTLQRPNDDNNDGTTTVDASEVNQSGNARDIQIDNPVVDANTILADDKDNVKDQKADHQDTVVPVDTVNTNDSSKVETGADGDREKKTDEKDEDKGLKPLWPGMNPHVSPTVFKLPKKQPAYLYVINMIIFLSLLGLPIIIVAILTGFRRGSHSSHAQRVWTMGWMVAGQILGLHSIGIYMAIRSFKLLKNFKDIDTLFKEDENGKMPFMPIFQAFVSLAVVIPFMAFPIGGYIVVGKMILSYGDCQKIG